VRGALTLAIAGIAWGCVTDGWHLPADACARCDEADVAAIDASAAPDVDDAGACEGPPVRALALGYNNFACALRCDGSVWCWGVNTHGQLGDETTVSRSTPVRVRGLGGPATAIGAGYAHACAVVRGEVRCWGRNLSGALGDGTRTDRSAPVTVQALGGVAVTVEGGGLHTCALLEGGELRCWGANDRGQLGDGTDIDRTTPRAVVALDGAAAQLALGQYSTCARLADGGVRCWGFNTFGALGDGTMSHRSAPHRVELPEAARDLSLAANHVCAALASGAAWCWGYNVDGGLGDQSTAMRLRPVAAHGLDFDVAAVAAGGRHSCARSDDGRVRCWGGNERGQLGDGTTTRALHPVDVLDPGGEVTLLRAADAFTCAALRDGRVRCWGANTDGQLGDGALRDAPAPVTVHFPP
jgi:alpha-tubulin suppressor-like RCC1 family protein